MYNNFTVISKYCLKTCFCVYMILRMKTNDIYRFMDGEVDQIWLKQCLSEVTFLQWSWY